MKEIYLAGGCFWGVEEYFTRIIGVLDTDVGYANSNVKYPSYEQVCEGTTRAAETVLVKYDDNVVNLNRILEYYFLIINPTSLNKQGNDVGTQYRTGIYYTNEEDAKTIIEHIKVQQKKHNEKIAVEVEALTNFFSAEEYHQDYLKKNPKGYCHVDFSVLDK